MIHRWNDYDKVKGYGDYQMLPKGGYVVKILVVSVGSTRDGRDYLKLSCDVIEGEYANFYTQQYRENKNEDKKWGCNFLVNIPTDDGSEQDGWTKRSFRTFIDAVEESNNGYHWDWNETKLKGLIFGGIFNMREYEKTDGSIGQATNFARCTSAEKIRTGKFQIPADKLLKKQESGGYNPNGYADGFMSIPDSADSEGLPFN